MTKKTKLVILIPVGAAILNGLGYLIAINLRTPTSAKGGAPLASAEERRTAPADQTPEAARGAQPGGGSTDDREREERALARKAAGVAALEAGDYDRAIAAFAQARSIAGDKAYVSELMRVAEDLAHRQPSARRVTPPSRPASPPPVVRSPPRSRVVEHVVAQEAPPPPPVDPPPPPVVALPPANSGLLLVTTTPRGLLVQVDDVPVDLTPTRASLKVGPHRVALLDGERKVYETTVEVRAGSPTTLLRDLSGVVAPSSPTRSATPTLAKEDISRVAPPPESAPPIRSAQAETSSPPSPSPPATAPVALTGALEITSPGLYGEVWVNGRPRGFPPLVADDLPPGPARVGVRVNGVEERSTTVAVRPGMTTSVRLGH
jgi:hypothetical protein